MLHLNSEEQQWLADYQLEITHKFPDAIEQITVFGSKARGDFTADSDLDIMVVIKEGDWRRKEAIARPGHLLAIGSNVVPSFVVYTQEEWEQRRKGDSPFWQAVTRDGVAVF